MEYSRSKIGYNDEIFAYKLGQYIIDININDGSENALIRQGIIENNKYKLGYRKNNHKGSTLSFPVVDRWSTMDEETQSGRNVSFNLVPVHEIGGSAPVKSDVVVSGKNEVDIDLVILKSRSGGQTGIITNKKSGYLPKLTRAIVMGEDRSGMMQMAMYYGPARAIFHYFQNKNGIRIEDQQAHLTPEIGRNKEKLSLEKLLSKISTRTWTSSFEKADIYLSFEGMDKMIRYSFYDRDSPKPGSYGIKSEVSDLKTAVERYDLLKNQPDLLAIAYEGFYIRYLVL